MTRAERRARTERVVERRRRHWLCQVHGQTTKARVLDLWQGYRAGRSRKVHPFDCGQPGCFCKMPVNDHYRRDARLLAEALDEAAHPECWPAQVRADLFDIEDEIWLNVPFDFQPRELAQRFLETFPL